MKRNVEIRDLMSIRMISDPQISPDGSRISFVHTTINYEKDEYESNIWLADVGSGKSQQFTSGRGKDKNPRWSPDGRSLLFTSVPPARDEKKDKEKKEKKPQLYVIPLHGGEAARLTDLEGGVDSPRWSPDGKRILFLSAFREKEPEGDVRVIDRLQYRFNGKGYFDGRRPHVFTIGVKGGKPRQVTRSAFDVDSAEWLKNGKEIAFVSNLEPNADLTWEKFLYSVSSGGGEPKRLTDGPRVIASFRPSPKGDTIAYVGHDFRKGLATNGDVWLVPAGGGASKNLTRAFDQDIGNSMSCDTRVASPNPNPQWSSNGEHIYFTSTYYGAVRLYRVPEKGGKVEHALGDVDHGVEAYTISDGGAIAFTHLEATTPIELWIRQENKTRKITDFNRRWSGSLNICNHERFEFRSSAGHMVEGWVMRPPGFKEWERYPMVLEIHGGPRSAYGHSLMHEFQLLAAQGWVVAYINPFGSGGYYEDFQAGLPGHYGEQDYADIMEAVDHLLSRCDFIDPSRLGVTGGSYGGFMTNWIVTHTDRFRAAVTQRAISNWVSLFGCSDIGWTFTKWELEGTPWTDEEKYMAKSPIRYAARVKTPTLIIHSEEDYRCPIEQGEQFFTALKFHGVPTELVRFPGENHDLSRNGKPKHREERLNHITRWFKTYL